MQIAFLTSLTDIELDNDIPENDGVNALNDSGLIVGYSLNDAVKWVGGNPSVIWSQGDAIALNAAGEIVGYQTLANGTLYQAVALIGGALSVLPSAGSGLSSVAYAVNSGGMIIGEAYSDTDLTQEEGGLVWQNGQVLNTGAATSLYALNDAGQAIGALQISSTVRHAYLWQNGKGVDLGVLAANDSSTALAINNSGVVVGGDFSDSTHQQAVLWQNGAISALPTLAGDTYSFAESINDAGIIVGGARIEGTPGSDHAVMWINGQVTDLNSLLPANSGWTLQSAIAINNSDQIIGLGEVNGVWTNFVLTLGSGTPLIGASAEAVTTELPTTPIAVVDSVLNVAYYLNGLQTTAAAGELASIALTDAGTPDLSLTTTQLSSDSAALKAITGAFTLTVLAGSSPVSITGFAGHATTAEFSGDASQYTVTAANGVLTVTKGSVSDSLTDIAALQFADHTAIVAQTPGSGGTVTTGNITELYSAVLAREPDLGGLSYYQTYLDANPTTPLTSFATYFLHSTEYTGNPAHNYMVSSPGDASFIQDSYKNLLGRSPSAAEVSYYQTNVMAPAEANLTPGTQAFAAAQLQAHALMLVYFSNSGEFLSDVQITAQNPASAQHWLILT